MNTAEDRKTQLRNRKTRQKAAIQLAFRSLDRPLSIGEAHAVAQQYASGLSIATVYRNVNALIEGGVLTKVLLPGHATRYEVSGKQHHHHFLCTACLKSFNLPGCCVNERAGLPAGFQAKSHEYFIYGYCTGCNG